MGGLNDMKEILVGKKYGESTVIEQLLPRNGCRVVKMRCHCGNEYIAYVHSLNKGQAFECKSCRMKNKNVKDDLVGKKINRLQVIERADFTKNNKIVYKCLCDCQLNKPENEREYYYCEGTRLRSGKIISCGCFAKENMSVVKSKYNKYDLTGEYGIGWTSNTNKEFYFDLEDYDKIKNYNWYEKKDAVSKSYSSIEAYNKSFQDNYFDDYGIKIYWLITGSKYIDHINRNIFDNRKANLRVATPIENTRNHNVRINNNTGVSGVQLMDNGLYKVSIGVNYNKIDLGEYSSFHDAVVARLKAEKEYYGEFAPQKDLYKQYGII